MTETEQHQETEICVEKPVLPLTQTFVGSDKVVTFALRGGDDEFNVLRVCRYTSKIDMAVKINSGWSTLDQTENEIDRLLADGFAASEVIPEAIQAVLCRRLAGWGAPLGSASPALK